MPSIRQRVNPIKKILSEEISQEEFIELCESLSKCKVDKIITYPLMVVFKNGIILIYDHEMRKALPISNIRGCYASSYVQALYENCSEEAIKAFEDRYIKTNKIIVMRSTKSCVVIDL